MKYYPRFFQPPSRESYFLFGPRGIGKTTWLKHTFPEALWLERIGWPTFIVD